MNNISFQGINNLSIAKDAFLTRDAYMSSYGHIKHGNKNNLYVRIKCNLTNDTAGNHLDKFKEALDQCDGFYKQNCVNSDNIELIMRNYTIDNDKQAEFNSFKINGCEIPVHRNTLPLYTFMAFLTREASKHPTTTDTRRVYTDTVNSKVHKVAMDYIDNIM